MVSLLSTADAQDVLDFLRPSIKGLLKSKKSRREDFYLLIARRREDGTFYVLAALPFGENAEKYKLIAESKAGISARTGLSSREVQLMHPELIEPTDTMYWGSVVAGDLIVAGSGIQAFFDETIAQMVLALCLGMVQYNLEERRTVAQAAGGDFYNS